MERVRFRNVRNESDVGEEGRNGRGGKDGKNEGIEMDVTGSGAVTGAIGMGAGRGVLVRECCRETMADGGVEGRCGEG